MKFNLKPSGSFYVKSPNGPMGTISDSVETSTIRTFPDIMAENFSFIAQMVQTWNLSSFEILSNQPKFHILGFKHNFANFDIQ